MRIGLKPGTTGAEVERLHRVLTFAGLRIEPGEIKRCEFGPSTLKALQALQRRRKLPRRAEIDASTVAVLLEIEEKIAVNINLNEDNPPAKPPAQHEDPGIVQGKLVDENGAPVAGPRVSLYAKNVRNETRLGETKTDKQGQFSIAYRRPRALNLVVRAYNASGKVIAESATVFAAPGHVQVNFTTGASGIVRTPSIFATLNAAVTAELQKTPLSDLKENKDVHELQFLARSARVPFRGVAYLFISTILGRKNKIQTSTFFGIFYQGIPASLDAALSNLPDAGIDDAFMGQVLSGVLAHSRDSLSQALTAAVSANILPASYGAMQGSELALLDARRARNTGERPYIRGKTPLKDVFEVGGVADVVKVAFTQAYADNGGHLGPTWKALRANKSLSAADLTTLETTLSVSELLTGNLPLIKDALNRLSQKTLASVQNLALLDEDEWAARIASVDPQASSIPQVLPKDTAQQRIARFAKALAGRFAGRYPTTAFAGGLSKAKATAFAGTRDELVTFIAANPTFSLGTRMWIASLPQTRPRSLHLSLPI